MCARARIEISFSFGMDVCARALAQADGIFGLAAICAYDMCGDAMRRYAMVCMHGCVSSLLLLLLSVRWRQFIRMKCVRQKIGSSQSLFWLNEFMPFAICVRHFTFSRPNILLEPLPRNYKLLFSISCGASMSPRFSDITLNALSKEKKEWWTIGRQRAMTAKTKQNEIT